MWLLFLLVIFTFFIDFYEAPTVHVFSCFAQLSICVFSLINEFFILSLSILPHAPIAISVSQPAHRTLS
jgi:hypothetical protein